MAAECAEQREWEGHDFSSVWSIVPKRCHPEPRSKSGVVATETKGLCFALLAFFLLLTSAAFAQSRSWRIQNFHSAIDLHKDGSAEVTERLTLLFNGEYHGINRVIPVDYPGPNGTNYSLGLKVEAVTGDYGQKLKYETSHKGRFENIRIYIPGAVDTTKIVNIRYEARAAAKFFKDYDEFYWNVTGNDWRVPIDAASAVVHLPPGINAQAAQAFTGAFGSIERDAKVSIQPGQVSFESKNLLSAREGLTIDVKLPKGALHEPSAFTRALRLVGANSILVLPVWAFAVMFWIKRKKGQSADPNLSVAPQYEPPPGMPPAECGTLVDNSTNPRDITSTLVDLAVRGYLKIKEVEVTHFLRKTEDYQLQFLKNSEEDWGKLAPYEQIMLNHIFGAAPAIYVSQLKNQFYVAIPKIRETVMSELDRKGMYSVDPGQAYGLMFVGAAVIAAPFLLAAFLFHVDFFQAGVWAIVAIAITVGIVFLFGRDLTATTLRGSRTKIQILGFREFMERVDADRLKRMPPNTFEKYLAYAMALGVEQHWAKAFEGIVQDPPTWYEGPSGFYPGYLNTWAFTQSLNNMVRTTGEAFVAAPAARSSSTGYGGGGGGSSGGGFGGGGGDAF
jgi:uncharacterized membrane protein